VANPDDAAYRELYLRWFEFGTFCPIFRVHGTRTTNQNELRSYGPEAQAVLVAYDRRRCRLMPYIYSLAWKTTSEGYTIMRPVVMEFRGDTYAQNVGDQFLFGPAIFVSPVNEPGANTRHLYLLDAQGYDCWTGRAIKGPRSTEVHAPVDRIPLAVRAGSILPLDPDLEYAAEKPADPIDVRASFRPYEDEDHTYNYGNNAHAAISISWDDAAQTVTFGDRVGALPGMLEWHTLRIVFVRKNHGVGGGLAADADKTISYSGKQITLTP
jgi:alpha-D-xyloside xylohydrolase